VSANYDPLDVAQYAMDKFSTVATAAENWRTYLNVHAWKLKAIKAAIRTGIPIMPGMRVSLNPYPGKLGAIEEGAYADMILVDANPLQKH
jgi:imidazolonepropionase-like amidohydrolase